MAAQNVIVVEGEDDWNFLNDLLRNSRLEEYISISCRKKPRVRSGKGISGNCPIEFFIIEGQGNFSDVLEQELRQSELQRIGIVLDADENVDQRWLSIKEVLAEQSEIHLPNAPLLAGTVIANGDGKQAGVWLMPNNNDPGMLEDFLAMLVPDEDKLWPHARRSLEEAMQLEQRFADVHRSKALVRTWLAWQEEPGTPFGLTLTRKYLNITAPPADAFFDWISRLFSLPV